MRIYRDAAPVIAHRHPSRGPELELDSRGKPGHRLVHCVVERLGREMMQRPLVGAADIHARPPAHRLQTFEDFDILG